MELLNIVMNKKRDVLGEPRYSATYIKQWLSVRIPAKLNTDSGST
ncbi:hypothetical protein [Grimontia hollisae]|nr:hypothetical protein [Grimontia hollisae]